MSDNAKVIAFPSRAQVSKERCRETWKLACSVLEPVFDLKESTGVTTERLDQIDALLGKAVADLYKI